MALIALEDDTCKGCGQPISDSQNPDLEEAWAAEVIRCHACAAATRRANQFQKDGDMAGAHIHVHPRRERRG